MLDDIYNKRILKLAADIPRIGHLDAPDGSATAVSKLCGSKVSVEVKMDGDAPGKDLACTLQSMESILLQLGPLSIMVHPLSTGRCWWHQQ